MIVHTVEQTQKFLNKNKQVMITNADKGNITVAMYKRDHEEKMKDILRKGLHIEYCDKIQQQNYNRQIIV